MLKKANSPPRLTLKAAAFALLLLPFFAQAAAAQADEDGLAPALAYLDRAIEYYNAGNRESAARSIEAGLLYSDIPADFFYLKALVLFDGGSPIADSLEAAEAAFDGSSRWFRFDTEPAAVFTAQLLADTGRFSEALALLDGHEVIPSAETDLLRCKAFYALGDIDRARNAIDAALRRWPADARFPLLFFQFEAFHRLDPLAGGGTVAELSSAGRTQAFSIASWIVRAWNLLANPNAPIDVSLAAVPFLRQTAPSDAASMVTRLWSSGGFEALDPQAAAFLAVETLRDGAAFEDEAIDAFFSLAESASGIPLAALEYLVAFAAAFPGEELREEVASRLSGFTGVISADATGDLVADSRVSYRLGRPYSAIYDLNQDGYPDMVVTCGFGEPVSILFPRLRSEIEYQSYPYTATVRVKDAVFVQRAVSFACAPLAAQSLGADFLSPEFLFLQADAGFSFPSESELIADSVLKVESGAVAASKGGQATVRRETFYDERGRPASQREIVNGAVVSRTIFKDGQSAERDSDRDGDGYFETKIVYGANGAETLLVDTDGDMSFNYSETIVADGSVLQSWIDAGTSLPSVQWSKAPDGSSAATWLHPATGEEVTATFAASALDEAESFSVFCNGEARLAFYDAGRGLWWLDFVPPALSAPASADVAGTASRLKQSGLAVVSDNAEFEGGFVRVLKIGGYLFAETVYTRQDSGA